MKLMNAKKFIQGAGGGGKTAGGGGHVPVEATDSLQSKAFAAVLDLVCEGEIEGLASGLQSVYLDGTPITNPDGSNNFTGVEFDSRAGSQDQDYIPQFSDIESETSVGVQVVKTDVLDVGVIRTITNESVDAVRVRLSIPQLTEQDTSSGDLHGSELEYFIEMQSNGGGYTEVARDIIIGKTTSKYERSYRIDLEGDGPWDIRVRRQTLDSTTVALQNKLYWESYTEIIDGKLRYPNSALAALKVDASQFSSIPTRGYDCKLMKIKIPANATVRDDGSLTYSGDWDGTFQVAWSSNPAWCFYDLITNTRYGLGNFISESSVDKWGLYTVGQYCDELINDGFGSTEPRFSCNLYLQSRAEAYKVLQDMASIFRAMTYYAEGTISVVQDSPSDPVYLYTPSNVVDGLFTYAGSSAKARHTVAVVTWNDPSNFYQQKVEYVEDQDAIARYGVIETEVVALGCTSQGQAHRLGKWILFSERYQTETVSFKTGIGGAVARPGQVIQIADPVRAGSRRGGRISTGSTTSYVTLDQELSINALETTISVLLPDGTVETKQIDKVVGNKVYPTSDFSLAPEQSGVWTIQSATVNTQTFKVVAITEAKDGTHEISALAHNPDKYDAIENDLKIQEQSISSLTTLPDAPQGLALTETLYAVGNDVRTKITVSWNYVQGATGYVVQYQFGNGNVITLPETSINEVEILNAQPGDYTATVYAVNSIGQRSTPATASKTILGKSAAPADVTGFSLLPVANMAYLSWDKTSDLDVLIGGSVRIRYSPDIVTPVWKDSVDITPALPGTTTRAQVPLMVGTYMAKFVDSSGISSDTEADIVTTIPQSLALNVVDTETESPTFPGTKTDCFVTTSFGGGLAMQPSTPIDDWGDIDDVLLWDFNGGVTSEATYEFQNVVDLGGKYTSRVTASIQVAAVDVTESIDERLDPIDDWVDLDGDFIDDVNAELFVATSDDNSTWSDWKRFFVGEYPARYFKFKVVMTSLNTAHNLLIQSLSVTIDMPDRVVQQQGISSGAGAYTVTFAEAFKAVPAIGITAYNMNTGDYWAISANTVSGFQITFKNAGGSAVSRNFDYMAKGYGRVVA